MQINYNGYSLAKRRVRVSIEMCLLNLIGPEILRIFTFVSKLVANMWIMYSTKTSLVLLINHIITLCVNLQEAGMLELTWVYVSEDIEE